MRCVRNKKQAVTRQHSKYDCLQSVQCKEELSTYCRSPEPLLTISRGDLDKKAIQMNYHERLRSSGNLDKKEIKMIHHERLSSKGDLDKLAIQMPHPRRLRSAISLPMHPRSLKYSLFAPNFPVQTYSPEVSCEIVSDALDAFERSVSLSCLITKNNMMPSMTSLLNQKISILRQVHENQSAANMAACQIKYTNGVRRLKY
eukprot:13244669-Ditylum_brightwellii.AAC.1